MKRGLAFGASFAIPLLLISCAARPTPYQPLGPGGGYEETRLQDNVYRVSFKGNRYTAETEVLDFLYLRCAELTLSAGYTHFAVVDSFGSVNFDSAPRSRLYMEMGYSRHPAFWSVSDSSAYGSPYDRDYWLDSRLAIFVIRMEKMADGAGGEKETLLDARHVVDSLAAKKTQSSAPAY